jgi:hypothetical protein
VIEPKSRGFTAYLGVSGILDRPLSRAMTAEGRGSFQAATGTGSAVTDLIFSIANREVTFFSGTAPISFL